MTFKRIELADLDAEVKVIRYPEIKQRVKMAEMLQETWEDVCLQALAEFAFGREVR